MPEPTQTEEVSALTLLQVIAGRLQAVSSQMDLLIRLECEAKPRSELRDQLLAFDAEREAAQVEASESAGAE